MTSYLICWKPADENQERGWPERQMVALAEKFARGEVTTEPWRFKRRNGVRVRQRVFLLRQGKRGRAIFGYGFVAVPPGPDARTEIQFTGLLSPQSGTVYANEQELIGISGGMKPWNTQSSGIALDPAIAAQLEELVIDRDPIADAGPQSQSNPTWTRDELILALDLYFREPAARGSKTHPACAELSALLNSLPLHDRKAATFRNANGVAMKLSNFLRFDPTYKGVGLPGGAKGEKEVWDTFSDNLPRLRAVAEAIRLGAAELATPAAEDVDEEAEEGGVLFALHRRRERAQGLIAKKKSQVLKTSGTLQCEVCNFDFAATYGELGHGFAECHHGKPLAEMKAGDKTRLADLHIVCANCHRMLHRKFGRSVANLCAVIESHRGSKRVGA